MSDFERIDNSWEQAEQFRHAALLRQLKAELQAFRQQSRPASPSMPPSKAPPDPKPIKRVRS